MFSEPPLIFHMKNGSFLGLARIVLVLVYVLLVRDGYHVMYVDGCLDAGGTIGNSDVCLGVSLGEVPDLGATAPFWFWIALLNAPALFVWALYRALAYLLRRLLANQRMEPTR
jgi:hypothetical protein